MQWEVILLLVLAAPFAVYATLCYGLNRARRRREAAA